MKIYLTKHSELKLKILERHGIKISKRKIAITVRNPDVIDYSRRPLIIAHSSLNTKHVLRVVYKKEGDIIIIITFYPGRKTQYAKR